MNQKLRFAIALILLVSVVFLARNQVAWAIESSALESTIVDSGSESAAADVEQNLGSVRPPPPVVIPVTSGTYSVGGVCILKVTTLAQDVSLVAELLEFDVLDERPEDITRYLAGVCELTYRKSGELTTDLVPSDADVRICFADVPNSTNQIFVYNDKDETWTALETSLEDGLKCALANKTGKYVLSELP